MLDLCLMVEIGLTGGLQEGGVKNFLLDGRMHRQCCADLLREALLDLIRTCGFKLIEPFRDLLVVSFQ
jgi:hypothetical protein